MKIKSFFITATLLTFSPVFSSILAPAFAATSALTQRTDKALENLRSDWKKRDPLLKGKAFIVEETQYQQRVLEIIQNYEKALAQDSKDINAYLGLAEVKYIYQKRFQPVTSDEVMVILKKAVEMSPNHVRAHISLAEFIYFHVPEYKKTPSQEQIKSKQTLQRVEALQVMQDIHQKQSQDIDLNITYADLLSYEPYLNEDIYVKAYQVLASALKAHPNNEKLLMMQGRVLVRHGLKEPNKPNLIHFKSAQTHFTQVISLTPKNTAAYLEKAQVELQLKDIGGAIDSLKSLLKVSPRDTKALFLLAELLIKANQKTFDTGLIGPPILEAKRHYSALIADLNTHKMGYSEQVLALNNLGLISYAQGQNLEKSGQNSQAILAYAEAIGHYKKAVGIFDRIKLVNALIQKELAKSYLAHGRLLKPQNAEKARQSLQRACDLKLEAACKAL